MQTFHLRDIVELTAIELFNKGYLPFGDDLFWRWRNATGELDVYVKNMQTGFYRHISSTYAREGIQLMYDNLELIVDDQPKKDNGIH